MDGFGPCAKATGPKSVVIRAKAMEGLEIKVMGSFREWVKTTDRNTRIVKASRVKELSGPVRFGFRV